MSMLEKALEFYNKGITVTPERYETLKDAHKGVGEVWKLAGEALEEMGPNDDTPYRLTGGEVVERTFAKLGVRLGN